MARQHMRFSVRGVGGGRANVRRPSASVSAPRLASIGRGRVRIKNGKRKA